MSHIVFQAFICALQCVLSILIFYLMGMQFRDEGFLFGSFLCDFFFTLFLITFAADMMGLLVSCCVHSTTAAMTVMPLLLIVQLVFAGVAFPLSGRMNTISNFTLSKWGIHAICTEANYNSLPSTSMYNMMTRFSENEVMSSVLASVNRADVDKWSSTYAQEIAYDYSFSNLFHEWRILIWYTLFYAIVGLIAL